MLDTVYCFASIVTRNVSYPTFLQLLNPAQIISCLLKIESKKTLTLKIIQFGFDIRHFMAGLSGGLTTPLCILGSI